MSATISSLLYVQSDTGITFPWPAPGHKEKLITIMEFSGTDDPDKRVAALEQKLTNMEALVRGLIAELLDIKAITRTLLRDGEERTRRERTWLPTVPGTLASDPVDEQTPATAAAVSSNGSMVIRPRSAHPPAVPVAPAEPVMVMIMQTDGTMKLEPRYGEAKHIDSTGGYGRNRKDASGKSTQNPLIYAAEKDKSDTAKT